ncbi:MAG: hypothetical protein K0R54_4312 [Clostridiaceae bacterium]|jgi:hypothetical protein|nr:hypothetical protein [Clostridiaceae bacterium]
MKVAEEFSNSNTYGNLNQSKIFALLDIPSEEREDFISQSHTINGQTKTVDVLLNLKEYMG